MITRVFTHTNLNQPRLTMQADFENLYHWYGVHEGVLVGVISICDNDLETRMDLICDAFKRVGWSVTDTLPWHTRVIDNEMELKDRGVPKLSDNDILQICNDHDVALIDSFVGGAVFGSSSGDMTLTFYYDSKMNAWRSVAEFSGYLHPDPTSSARNLINAITVSLMHSKP